MHTNFSSKGGNKCAHECLRIHKLQLIEKYNQWLNFGKSVYKFGNWFEAPVGVGLNSKEGFRIPPEEDLKVDEIIKLLKWDSYSSYIRKWFFD